MDSKQSLIKKALGTDNLPIEVTEGRISFPWFHGTPIQVVPKPTSTSSPAFARWPKEVKRVTAIEKPIANEKYAFRCFLLRLGFIGNEYKTYRKILLKNLTGSAAFKSDAKK